MCRRHNILITPHKRDSAQCGEILMHGMICVQKARHYDQLFFVSPHQSVGLHAADEVINFVKP